MTLLRFARDGGTASPYPAEHVEVGDDGVITGWRSVARAVGWFRGSLPDAVWDALHSAVARAGATADEVQPPASHVPGTPVETLALGAGDPAVVGTTALGTPVGNVVVAARRLLDEGLLVRPRAAVTIRGGARPRLVHVGREPLPLDLSDLAVRPLGPPGPDVVPGARRGSPEGRIEARPGWELELLSTPERMDPAAPLAVDLHVVREDGVVRVQVQRPPVVADLS